MTYDESMYMNAVVRLHHWLKHNTFDTLEQFKADVQLLMDEAKYDRLTAQTWMQNGAQAHARADVVTDENIFLREWLRGELTLTDADIDDALRRAARVGGETQEEGETS